MRDERILAYLLKELPEGELEQFENECFDQETWPEQINLVEEDLIDDYLHAELPPQQSQHFEQNYLTTPARLERVRLAAALIRHADTQKAATDPALYVQAPSSGLSWTRRLQAFWSGQPWPLSAAVALALIAIVGGVWWLFSPRHPVPGTFATLTLNASATNRSEGAKTARVRLAPDVEALKISLTLPEPAPPQPTRYRVELDNNEGATWPLAIAGQDAQTVYVTIPAQRLARGRYALNLLTLDANGVEQPINAIYFFTVE
jgi:hypothetical protein